VNDVRAAFQSVVSEDRIVDKLLGCFHFAWQNEDPDANRVAGFFGLGKEHLYALDGNIKQMLEEIYMNRY
jgi:hypothetical protein